MRINGNLCDVLHKFRFLFRVLLYVFVVLSICFLFVRLLELPKTSVLDMATCVCVWNLAGQQEIGKLAKKLDEKRG